MPTSSFNNKKLGKQESREVEVVETDSQSQSQETQIVVAPSVQGVEGEVTQDDFQKPRMVLANTTGALGQDFDQGQYILEKTMPIGGDGAPVIFVVRHAKLYYEEITDIDDGFGEKLDTIHEVREQSGILCYGKKDVDKARARNQVPFRKICDLTLLVKAPEPENDQEQEAIEELFPFEYKNEFYGFALFTARGGSFKISKDLLYGLASKLKNNWDNSFWEMDSRLKKEKRNSYWRASVKKGEDTTEEFRNWLKEII